MSTATLRPGIPRWIALLGMMALALAGLVVAPAKPAAAAPSGVQVFVGYADTLRANPTAFPTPWSGSPGVVFAGCTTSCTFDAGAVRVVNNNPGPVTIDSVTVSLSTCVFDMWPHGTVLQSGQQLIVTQTASGAAGGCDNSAGFFDTSDIGPNGANWAGNCSQSGVIPKVDVSIDGTDTPFQDTGQVLNTGGVDKASCPNGSNESTQWTSVGSQPCPGAVLSLLPTTQTHAVGSQANLQATLSCGGVGLQGASITFAASSGPNTGTLGTAATDANGVASFSYTSAATGDDKVVASTANPAGTINSPPVDVIWQLRQPTITITGASSGDFHDPATVSGVLSDSAGPVTGQPLTFTLNGSETCTGTTDASGAASCTITPGEAAGSYPLVASFPGDAGDLPASATASFAVTHEETTLTYTGPTKAANGQPVTLSGVLTEDSAPPIAGRTVTFTLGTGSSAQSCSGTTGGSGTASCTITSVNQPASSFTIPVTAAFAGDAFYLPSSASATLTVNYLTGRAFGLSSSGLVGISPTPDTGRIATTAAGTFAPPCVLSIGGLISAHTLCAKVVTSLNPGTSTATASLQDATIGVLGLPVIKVGLIQSSSQTSCGGSSGDTTITSVTVGGIPVNVNLHPGPNTSISVLGITLLFNEQVPVAGADAGLTVNALHIKALGLLDVTIASSTSDVHNC